MVSNKDRIGNMATNVTWDMIDIARRNDMLIIAETDSGVHPFSADDATYMYDEELSPGEAFVFRGMMPDYGSDMGNLRAFNAAYAGGMFHAPIND